jgi:hypothetical protein
MTQPRNNPGVLGKLFVLIVGGLMLALGFLFSVVLLTVVAAVGLVAFGYFWWKTRALQFGMKTDG